MIHFLDGGRGQGKRARETRRQSVRIFPKVFRCVLIFQGIA
jgi:hypothetical protein